MILLVIFLSFAQQFLFQCLSSSDLQSLGFTSIVNEQNTNPTVCASIYKQFGNCVSQTQVKAYLDNVAKQLQQAFSVSSSIPKALNSIEQIANSYSQQISAAFNSQINSTIATDSRILQTVISSPIQPLPPQNNTTLPPPPPPPLNSTNLTVNVTLNQTVNLTTVNGTAPKPAPLIQPLSNQTNSSQTINMTSPSSPPLNETGNFPNITVLRNNQTIPNFKPPINILSFLQNQNVSINATIQQAGGNVTDVFQSLQNTFRQLKQPSTITPQANGTQTISANYNSSLRCENCTQIPLNLSNAETLNKLQENIKTLKPVLLQSFQNFLNNSQSKINSQPAQNSSQPRPPVGFQFTAKKEAGINLVNQTAFINFTTSVQFNGLNLTRPVNKTLAVFNSNLNACINNYLRYVQGSICLATSGAAQQSIQSTNSSLIIQVSNNSTNTILPCLSVFQTFCIGVGSDQNNACGSLGNFDECIFGNSTDPNFNSTYCQQAATEFIQQFLNPTSFNYIPTAAAVQTLNQNVTNTTITSRVLQTTSTNTAKAIAYSVVATAGGQDIYSIGTNSGLATYGSNTVIFITFVFNLILLMQIK